MTLGLISPMAGLGVFCTVPLQRSYMVCECCTKIILPALQETCQGDQVGVFQKEQQHLSVWQALTEWLICTVGSVPAFWSGSV